MQNEKRKTKNGLVAVAGLLFFISFLTFNVNGQTLPNTEIFLVPIDKTEPLVLGEPKNATKNHVGYDNQPSFSQDGQFMYYSSIRDDDKTDIYAVFIPGEQNVEFISTGSVSEYLPFQKPDMSGISLLRVDENARAQQIWFFETDASEKCLTPDLTNVGYYTWLSDTMIAMRLEGDTNKLLIRNLKTNTDVEVTKRVGTSLGKIPSENGLYFTKKIAGKEILMRYYYDTNKTDTLLSFPTGVTEFAVCVDGSLWAANKGIIYRWQRASAKWDTVKDFTGTALATANRVALPRNMQWVAVVVEGR
jgi:hypothetical protein